MDGALKAIIHRMEMADMSEKSSRDFAEQCVKVSANPRGGSMCTLSSWILCSGSIVGWNGSYA